MGQVFEPSSVSSLCPKGGKLLRAAGPADGSVGLASGLLEGVFPRSEVLLWDCGAPGAFPAGHSQQPPLVEARITLHGDDAAPSTEPCSQSLSSLHNCKYLPACHPHPTPAPAVAVHLAGDRTISKVWELPGSPHPPQPAFSRKIFQALLSNLESQCLYLEIVLLDSTRVTKQQEVFPRARVPTCVAQSWVVVHPTVAGG